MELATFAIVRFPQPNGGSESQQGPRNIRRALIALIRTCRRGSPTHGASADCSVSCGDISRPLAITISAKLASRLIIRPLIPGTFAGRVGVRARSSEATRRRMNAGPRNVRQREFRHKSRRLVPSQKRKWMSGGDSMVPCCILLAPSIRLVDRTIFRYLKSFRHKSYLRASMGSGPAGRLVPEMRGTPGRFRISLGI